MQVDITFNNRLAGNIEYTATSDKLMMDVPLFEELPPQFSEMINGNEHEGLKLSFSILQAECKS